MISIYLIVVVILLLIARYHYRYAELTHKSRGHTENIAILYTIVTVFWPVVLPLLLIIAVIWYPLVFFTDWFNKTIDAHIKSNIKKDG